MSPEERKAVFNRDVLGKQWWSAHSTPEMNAWECLPAHLRELYTVTAERDAERERSRKLREALLGVVCVADRDTHEFDLARATLEETKPGDANVHG